MKKRLSIVVFYDGQGIVDRYVKYFLESLRSVSAYIVVVCNGMITAEGRSYFEENADDFFCRENKGLDITAEKKALEYVGWDKICEYDELILTNTTLFGPFYPLTEMFEAMEQRNADYWGAFKVFEDFSRTTLYGKDVLPYHHILDFTSANFRVIRKSLLHSYEFRNYWDNLPEVKDYTDGVLYGEIYFNKIFSDTGYVFDTYMSDDTRDACPSPNTNELLRMIIKERMPFIRRKAWLEPYEWLLNFGYGEEPYQALEYIKDNTDYDVSMIYENIIRTGDQYNIKNRLQYNFIIPEKHKTSEKISDAKIAVIAHIYYEDCVESSYEYFKNFPKKTDFYITVTDERVKALIDEMYSDIRYKVEVIENRGRDVSALLIPYKDVVLSGGYDYICFTHDKKTPHIDRKMGENFALRCFRAMFGTKHVVENIISLFDAHPEIGMISPQPVYHGKYFTGIGGSYTCNFPGVAQLAEKFGVKAFLVSDSPVVSAYGGVFWFRPKSLARLVEYDWKYQDFPEEPTGVTDETIMHTLEGFYAVMVQDSGYMPAYALTDVQARSEITNLTFMLNRLVKSFGLRGNIRSSEFKEVNRGVLSMPRIPLTVNNSSPLWQPSLQRARIYIDCGGGYSEAEAKDGGFVNAKEIYSCDFELEQKAKRIRFDPVNSTACLVRNVYAEADGRKYSVSPLNGFTINGISYFMNSDPQMIINTDHYVKGPLTVSADIVPLYDDVFYSIFEQYNEDHKKLKNLEDKLIGRDIPETMQLKYDPEEYGFNTMQDNTGKQILYFDTGSGYSEATARKTDGNKIGRSRLFEEEYSFKKAEPVRLRFDPANKCGCIVYGMEVVSNLGKLKYRCLNGFELYGTYVFFTNDSQFEIIVPHGSKLTKLKIKAFIVPVSDSLVFQALSDCRVNLERYNRLKKY